MRGGACKTEPERDEYGGGAGLTGVSNVGGGDGGTRLMVADGVALHEACTGEVTNECRHNDEGGHVSCLPTRGRSETEHDCVTSAYCGTYCDVRRMENENAYPSAKETNGTSENPPATRRRTRSPPSPNDDYGGPSPCAALCV